MNHKRTELVWRVSAVGVVLLLTLAASLVHRHFDRGLRAPLHCTACSASVAGAAPANPPVVDGRDPADAGRVIPDARPIPDVLLTVRSTGRSPPTA